jgi:signal recognition particle receptor subunit alpha
VNKPDLVLFVGEALVGNDGVDQLVEFDRRLVDHASDGAAPRRIDGIILTKFDTVDDKVGAALSMVYKTGIPVLFLGTGQQYTDLRCVARSGGSSRPRCAGRRVTRRTPLWPYPLGGASERLGGPAESCWEPAHS